jgi:predicted nucleotidyltransferase
MDALPTALQGILAAKAVIAAYLFGSRADGTEYANSDYDFGILLEQDPTPADIALVIQDFSDAMTEILNPKVDITILNTANIQMRFEIISKGTVIYCSDDDKRTDFEDIAIRDYLDFKPFLNLYYREVREAVREGGFYGQ